ncbi:grasp-with-spasm system ATP-grasp peptide maturase [Christiangramia marina]|uniref:grasp-with-spasm system ATP-grasp peptide maturase n=1 Tax=Christiangramia marina TaxID=409436 RepID=UPI003AA8445E
MVLILSRQDDGSTAFVGQWLQYLRKDFLRINGDSDVMKFKGIDMKNKKLLIEQNSQCYNIFDFSSFWYRRRGMSSKNLQVDTIDEKDAIFPDNISYHGRHMTAELKEIISYVHYIAEKNALKIIGGHESVNVNKLKVLDLAQDSGLKIPESYVMSCKEDLIELVNQRGNEVITKALSQGVYFFTKDRHYYSYTEKLTLESIEKLPNSFFPSLIQLEIKKKYELRIFYLHGQFYTMAIFSQNDDNTKVDFRKQNSEDPHRSVPFNLPLEIKEKLKVISQKLNLNTGSYDIIVDKDDNFIFLEVNPIGQFSMTSFPCNYYLEKKIAEYL